ncbi:hypothetical protein EV424DRAFT_48570 [Suillus variegatus]|nr:hypothetical protein EV424DRAFT_48570 [Suillus variegatus]
MRFLDHTQQPWYWRKSVVHPSLALLVLPLRCLALENVLDVAALTIIAELRSIHCYRRDKRPHMIPGHVSDQSFRTQLVYRLPR